MMRPAPLPTVEKSNQPLPVATPTNPEKGAIASNVVQSPPAADPGASAQQPLDHPTVGREIVLAQHADDPAASNMRHAISDLFGRGTAPAQHDVDQLPHAVIEKPSILR